MKKLFLFVLMMSVSLGVFAYNENNKVYLGIESGTYKYREPHLDYPISDKGDKLGVSVEWVGRHILAASGLSDESDKSFATFELRYITGKVDYTGFLMDGTPHVTKGEKDWYIEGRITLGEVYDLGGNFEIWPYLGFGYRYLVNDGSKVDPAAYKRISKYMYVPIGAKLSKSFSNGVSFTLTGEFDWFLSGEQASALGHLIPEIESRYIYNSQNRGVGCRFGLKAEVPLSKKLGFFVEPYYRFWKIQNSELGTSDVHVSGNTQWWYYNIPLYEPFNTTREAGIRAGIYF